MPDVRSSHNVPKMHVNEKEHRRMLADQANAGIPVLRDFTPVLRFGGATTGITYSTQLGRAVTYAGVVHEAWIDIDLTSKGSATGSATITGLLETNNSAVAACSADISMTNASVSRSSLRAEINSGSDVIDLYHAHGASTGAATIIDNTDFTNTTTLHIHISYRVV